MSIQAHACTAIWLAALLSGCGVAVPPATEHHGQPGLQRVWMLTGLNGVPRERLVSLQAQMDWTALPQATAALGCNRLDFAVQAQDNGQIRMGPLLSTRKHCPGRMDAEQQFSQRILKMQHYRLAGHQLVLRNDAGEEIRFVAQDWD